MSAASLADLLLRKRLMIFDFDGTIADSSPLHERAFNEAFESEGVTVDYSTIAGMTTESAVDHIAGKAGLRLDAAKRSSVIADKRQRARRHIASQLVGMDGSLEFIERVKGRYLLALCTSGSRDTIEVSLERLGLTAHFDPIVTGEDVARGKPDPEGFLRILDQHGMAASDAVVFEDSDHGMAAAAAAEIDTVQIVAGHDEAGGMKATWKMLLGALEQIQ